MIFNACFKYIHVYIVYWFLNIFGLLYYLVYSWMCKYHMLFLILAGPYCKSTFVEWVTLLKYCIINK